MAAFDHDVVGPSDGVPGARRRGRAGAVEAVVLGKHHSLQAVVQRARVGRRGPARPSAVAAPSARAARVARSAKDHLVRPSIPARHRSGGAAGERHPAMRRGGSLVAEVVDAAVSIHAILRVTSTLFCGVVSAAAVMASASSARMVLQVCWHTAPCRHNRRPQCCRS